MSFQEEIGRFHAALPGMTLPLGMGCASIGSLGDDATQRRFKATLEAAYEGGLRYFDTSAQYGGSEFRVGRFLRGIDRKEVFVATKSPVPASLTPQEAAFYVREGLRNSLERLGLTSLDLFQIHDVETLDQVLPPGGILDTLLEARRSGLIRYFGLATRFHDLLETAAAHGAFDTILTYCDYTPLEQSAGPLIAYAAGRGLGVINGSPLSFGLLTGQDPRNSHFSGDLRRNQGKAAKLYDFCAARGLSLLSLALRYPLQNPNIHMTLTGPASPDELRAALAACRSDLPPDVWADLQQTLGIPPPGA